jgi:hypothetical protein
MNPDLEVEEKKGMMETIMMSCSFHVLVVRVAEM